MAKAVKAIAISTGQCLCGKVVFEIDVWRAGPGMIIPPRALFSGRTGRQPLDHFAIEELQEWTYTGEPLVPLKGSPGVVWQRSKKKKRVQPEGMF
jgi:hypothetical protein